MAGPNGSSGLGSVSSELIERRTLEIVSAGLHCSFRMSRQMEPFEPRGMSIKVKCDARFLV